MPEVDERTDITSYGHAGRDARCAGPIFKNNIDECEKHYQGFYKQGKLAGVKLCALGVRLGCARSNTSNAHALTRTRV